MSRFNLLDEPWIRVIDKDDQKVEEVSLKTVFSQTNKYEGLAGDMEAQDFAVLRMLLAILHTVFSRFDADGNVYDSLALDGYYRPTAPVDEDDLDDYLQALMETWRNLWEQGCFPTIVNDYLEIWRDRFYLYDETYPFMQVTKELVGTERTQKNRKPGSFSGKTINRLLSESGNKIALFSPKAEQNHNKEKLKDSEVIRWLLTFHGYCGLADKTKYKNASERNSKGWLFDLGGIYLSGSNLFETLLLNLPLVHPEGIALNSIQKPAWEFSPEEFLDRRLKEKEIDNLAELYTTWGRAVYLDPAHKADEPFSINIVKLPNLNHENPRLELMSLWRVDEKEPDHFRPRKHREEEALWRSFGLIALPDSQSGQQKQVGMIKWLESIRKYLNDFPLIICAISLKDDGNATSWMPVEEIADQLSISDYVLADLEKDGWVPWIHGEVERTKKVADGIYRSFLKEIEAIRNQSGGSFSDRELAQLYFAIDQPFRQWLSGLEVHQSKEEAASQWEEALYRITVDRAKEILAQSGKRDYLGREVEKGKNDTQYRNIAMAYNSFMARINRELRKKGV